MTKTLTIAAVIVFWTLGLSGCARVNESFFVTHWTEPVKDGVLRATDVSLGCSPYAFFRSSQFRHRYAENYPATTEVELSILRQHLKVTLSRTFQNKGDNFAEWKISVRKEKPEIFDRLLTTYSEFHLEEFLRMEKRGLVFLNNRRSEIRQERDVAMAEFHRTQNTEAKHLADIALSNLQSIDDRITSRENPMHRYAKAIGKIVDFP